MGVINPIKNKETLEQMKDYLREKSSRNYLIFRIGLNFGLSVQELLQLRIEDWVDRDIISINGCKLQISPSLQWEIRHYLGDRKEGYFFTSTSSRELPISRFQLYMVLQDAARSAGYNHPIGALTLRKTFGYWAYMEKKIHLSLLCKYLNHHTVEYTLNYLGISDRHEPDNALPAMNL